MTVSRRDVLRLTAAAAAAPLVPSGLAADSPTAAAPAVTRAAALAAGRFFSAPEMHLLDELVEAIIPADAHSGGARAAGVAGYIDGRLAEYDSGIPDLRSQRERWKNGLAAVEEASREIHGKGFLEASPEERTALLERLAVGETLPTEERPEERRTPAVEKPETLGQRFFVELKAWTARGYYTSRVGIHDEMEYKGNTLLVEFSGTDPATLAPVPPDGRTDD